jgi:hypothetical protein
LAPSLHNGGRMKKLIPLLLVAITFAACGKFQSERKTSELDTLQVKVTSRLNATEFAAHCANKPGILHNGTTCVYESYRSLMLDKPSVAMTETMDYPLVDIKSGAAVYITGSVAPQNTVEVTMNGAVITGVPSSRPITTNGGKLGFRFRPGQIYGVKLYVYSCYDNALNEVRCPY